MNRIAVLMAAYNAEPTIRQALESVLASTCPVDVLIVDDCSERPVADFLGPVSENVSILRLDKNAGPAAARNSGLRQLLPQGYDYIAIADSDDVFAADRFQKQAAFLDSHPNVAVVGSWIRLITEAGKPFSMIEAPRTSEALRKRLFFNIAMAHSSCLFRADALARLGPYQDRYPVAEDYELLRRTASAFDIACLPECLVDYRVSAGNVSTRRARQQLWDRLRIQIRYFDALEWRSWAGALQTTCLLLAPRSAVAFIKKLLHPREAASRLTVQASGDRAR